MNTLSAQEINLAHKYMEAALQKGAQKVRICLNKSVMDLVGTLDGQIDKVTHCMDRAMSISLFADGKFGTFSTNRLEESQIDSFIDKSLATVRMLSADECRDLPDPSRTAKNATEGTELGLRDNSYESVTPEQRVEMALGASIFERMKTEASGCKLISEEAEYSDSIFDSLLIDSNGTMCRHIETCFEYGVEATVQDENGNKYSSYWWDSSPVREKLHLEDCCLNAYKKACAKAGPKTIEGGRFNMVVEAEVAAKLVNPIIKALSAYGIQQKNSFLAESLDKKVFSDAVNIIDDCHIKGQSGSRLFDSEGVATQTCPIIENGVVKRFFINTYMSGKLNMTPTIEDATRVHVMPYPKQGLDKKAIMEMCSEGILVTGFNGGNSNSATGCFSYGIEGFAFKDGKITHPVKEMLITGDFITLWNNLIAAGEDYRSCMSKLIPTLAFSNVDFSA